MLRAYIETSQLVCSANEFTGSMMMGTLVGVFIVGFEHV